MNDIPASESIASESYTSSMHLFLILSSVIFVVSMLSVFELRIVPAGKGARAVESTDRVESVRSKAAGFDVEDPFVPSFDVLAEAPAGLGEGFVDTDGPASCG